MTPDLIAALAIPLVITVVGAVMLLGRGIDFETFISGAKRGLESAVKLLPTLVALLVAVRMFRACGAVELIGGLIAPFCDRVGVPSEILSLLLTRPISGSAATASFSEILKTYGPDSFPSLCASVIMGSSDTLVYIISIYFSSLGLRKSRHAYPCATAIMLFCIFFSCLICRLWFKC